MHWKQDIHRLPFVNLCGHQTTEPAFGKLPGWYAADLRNSNDIVPTNGAVVICQSASRVKYRQTWHIKYRRSVSLAVIA